MERRDFRLSGDDEIHLNTRGLTWETVINGRDHWLLIHDFPIPEGYKTTKATAALRIVGDYLTGGIDMVYFSPVLERLDNQVIPATSGRVPIDGKQYQMWSRHRTAQNSWRPGIDDISTHLSLVEEWLKREFILRKGAS